MVFESTTAFVPIGAALLLLLEIMWVAAPLQTRVFSFEWQCAMVWVGAMVWAVLFVYPLVLYQLEGEQIKSEIEDVETEMNSISERAPPRGPAHERGMFSAADLVHAMFSAAVPQSRSTTRTAPASVWTVRSCSSRRSPPSYSTSRTDWPRSSPRFWASPSVSRQRW